MVDKRGRLLIFIVAYNAEDTIESVLGRIPATLLELYEIEILIIDDSSQDNTFAKSEMMRRAGVLPFNLHVLYNPVNQGYGGNQKIGFHYALEQGFDWVALVHGDGQYAPECLPELVDVLASGEADVVFGSRMIEKKAALKGGMPLYKYVGNKILTAYQNAMLGSDLSEFHSGYRLYSTAALAQIPFRLNSNDFHFDTEIIIQLIFAGQRIKELPIPTFYGDEICHVNGIKYAWDVFKATLLAKVQPLHIFYDPKYDCKAAEEDAGQNIAEDLYLDVLQAQDMPKGSNILVVGRFSEKLRNMLQAGGHQVSVKSGRFFIENIDENHGYDYIYLLEDSGMSRNPEEMVAKLAAVGQRSPELKICVTFANIGFFLTRVLLLFGRFAYTRRGIINLNSFYFFTLRSARKIFTQNGFAVTGEYGLPIPYSSLFASAFFCRLLTAFHKGLIKIRKSLFSFQFVIFVTPPTSLDHLLATAVEVSGQKVEVIDSGLKKTSDISA
ncbi:MAG: glycosyltransferase family 2 protein [Desulforhopalus sp.]